jgi:hypothetical protein
MYTTVKWIKVVITIWARDVCHWSFMNTFTIDTVKSMNFNIPELDCCEVVTVCGLGSVARSTTLVVVFVSFLADGLDEDGGE